MPHKKTDLIKDQSLAIHQHYLDILNVLPNVIYWTDPNGEIKGCNRNFMKLLNQKSPDIDNTSPYELLLKYSGWPESRIESLKLDDMNVIFSGKEEIDIEEAPVKLYNDKTIYYRARRVPMFDDKQQLRGLTVILTEEERPKKELEPRKSIKINKPSQKKKRNPEVPNILMVEDNVVAQTVEKALLKSLNCNVDIAETEDKAMKLFTPGKYDLILMDIGLEDTSGYHISKKIRILEEETDYHVPIIALTSYDAENVEEDCRYYKMDGVLTKPLSGTQADQILKHYLVDENLPVTGLKSF